MGICFACGKKLIVDGIPGLVGGNPVLYHKTCAKNLPAFVSAREVTSDDGRTYVDENLYQGESGLPVRLCHVKSAQE